MYFRERSNQTIVILHMVLMLMRTMTMLTMMMTLLITLANPTSLVPSISSAF